MLKLEATACIDAPAEDVWKWLSELDAVPLWIGAIKKAHCPAIRRGVGASRVCELKAATIIETIINWDEGRSFEYRGEGAPMLKEATNRWSVEPIGPGQTLIRTQATARFKGGLFGRMLEPLMRPMFNRLGAMSL